MRASKRCGVKRFLYASSASVYGIKDDDHVTEDLSLDPITIYARCKAEGERILNSLVDDSFVGVSVRSATVCGYSPRLRLDLTINLLTDQALTDGRIRVFGGSQMRPNVHILDLSAFYRMLLKVPPEKIQARAFNVSRENASVMSLAEMIRDELDSSIPIDTVPTDDPRSYNLSAARALEELGFQPKHDLATAVRELREAYGSGQVSDSHSDIYRNVAWMKARPELWRSAAKLVS
jgi:nucleoside-diphosphate-sugar epimerase